MRQVSIIAVVICIISLDTVVNAFVPSSSRHAATTTTTTTTIPSNFHTPASIVPKSSIRNVATTAQYPSSNRASSSASSSLYTTSLQAAPIPNPFQKLPWNVEREQRRKARKLRLERSALHRELGIAEDATYEEIVAATDALKAEAEGDLKRSIKIDVAKDKILQIRLNERLAGLTELSTEVRAQSSYETDGTDDVSDMVPKKKEAAEWNPPAWTQGLIVKPDAKQVKGQVRLWGIITLLGLGLPPAISYFNRFTWMVCIAQLSFRGMPRESMEGGGMGLAFGGGPGGKKHMKVAWLLGMGITVVGAILVYGLMPAWAKGQRYTNFIAFAMRNLIFGVACSYLQPYKG